MPGLVLGLRCDITVAFPQKAVNMADDKTKRGWQDRAQINVNEPYELRDWAKKFGITQEQLKDLVKKHGTYVTNIQRHLGNKLRAGTSSRPFSLVSSRQR
jgi:hypothetical protein